MMRCKDVAICDSSYSLLDIYYKKDRSCISRSTLYLKDDVCILLHGCFSKLVSYKWCWNIPKSCIHSHNLTLYRLLKHKSSHIICNRPTSHLTGLNANRHNCKVHFTPAPSDKDVGRSVPRQTAGFRAFGL